MDGSVAALDVCPAARSSSPASTRLKILVGTQGGDIVELISLARDGVSAAVSAATAAGAGISAVKSIEAADDVRNKDLSGADAFARLHSHSKGIYIDGFSVTTIVILTLRR
jgi:hypothetical protein